MCNENDLLLIKYSVSEYFNGVFLPLYSVLSFSSYVQEYDLETGNTYFCYQVD